MMTCMLSLFAPYSTGFVLSGMQPDVCTQYTKYMSFPAVEHTHTSCKVRITKTAVTYKLHLMCRASAFISKYPSRRETSQISAILYLTQSGVIILIYSILVLLRHGHNIRIRLKSSQNRLI
jgi:hypothetical protein